MEEINTVQKFGEVFTPQHVVDKLLVVPIAC